MRRFVWWCVGLLVLAGCDRPPDVAVENPREVIHQEVIANENNCFRSVEAYCVYDRARLDAIIDERVERQFHGELPTMRRDLTRLVRAVDMRYSSSSLETEERRAEVLAKMQEHYHNAPITRLEHRAEVDLGYVPTGFEEYRRSWRLVRTSPLVEGRQPRTPHIARQLLRLREAQPDAASYAVVARVATGAGMTRTHFVWRQDDIVWVTRDQSLMRTTLPLGPNLEGLLDGSVSLSEGMHRCAGEAQLDPLCH
ncbi:MAG: hypothetical protein AB8H86_21685 [Polyangiales bacterium]